MKLLGVISAMLATSLGIAIAYRLRWLYVFATVFAVIAFTIIHFRNRNKPSIERLVR